MRPASAQKVACVACGRVVHASKNGHPRRHSPTARLRNSGSAAKVRLREGVCDGTFLPGEKP